MCAAQQANPEPLPYFRPKAHTAVVPFLEFTLELVKKKAEVDTANSKL